MPNKKAFDLTVAVIVATVFGPIVLARLWSTRRLMEGNQAGVGYSTAKVVKAATA
jgi:hypothetical protein